MKTLKIIIILFLTIIIMPTARALDYSSSSIVIDKNSGRILYQNNSHEKRLIASTTKILTAIIVIEKGNLDREVKVGQEVLKMYGTNIYIEVGEKLKVIDLLYGLLLRSGNDAAVTLAVATSKTEENFVAEMNQKAQEIGMKDSIFANPHGLDEETKNYSTAYDMALLMQYASKNPIFSEISATKKYTVSTGSKTYLWYNRNKLLTRYKYCTGGKNGYTPSAGKTLVSTASKDNLDLITVSLNDSDTYTTHEKIDDYVFSKYKNYKIIDKDTFSIDKTFTTDKLYLKEDFCYPLTEEETEKIKTIVNIDNKSKKGNINIYLDNKKIGSLTIYKEQEKKEESFFSKLRSLFRR